MKIYSNRYTTASLTAIMATLLLLGMAIAAPDATAPTTASVTVNEFLSVTLSGAPIAFPNADPLETVNASTGYPLIATIGPESNAVGISIKIKGATEFCTDYSTCSGSTMPIGSMEWDNDAFGTGTAYTISDAVITGCTSMIANDACYIYHRLTVPTGQASGIYSTGITVTATNT